MKKRVKVSVFFLFVILLAGVLVYGTSRHDFTIGGYSTADRPPRIYPDYCDIVIPPNIAPLNFLVQEDGLHYHVKIYSKQGHPIEVFSKTPKIMISQHAWRTLLNQNKGEELYFDVFVKTKNNQWKLFSTITNKIARENIDGYLVYRKIHPVHSSWDKIGIYQRNLQNYDESVVLDNKNWKGCLNCHSLHV